MPRLPSISTAISRMTEFFSSSTPNYDEIDPLLCVFYYTLQVYIYENNKTILLIYII